MSKIKTKAFAQIIKEIHLSYNQLEKLLSDKRLTMAERKLIKCWYYLRKGDPNKILETLEQIDANYDPLVTAQKDLLTGIAFIWKGHLQKALILIKNSTRSLKEYEDIGNIYFLAIYNYFIVSLNLKNKIELDYAMDELKRFPQKDQKQELSFLNCIFHYHNFYNEHEKAERSIKKIEPLKQMMNESIFMAYATGKYIHYIKLEKFDKCYEVLEEIKKRRSFYSRSNFLFMKVLLDHYCHQIPIYAYAKDYKDSPFLFAQILVIKNLEEDKLQEAQKHWLILQREMPDIYKNNFSYHGPKDIFSLCLNKHHQQSSEETYELPSKKEDALLHLLQKTNTKISLEKIYHAIWGEEILDKNDINKLKKLISRVRKNKQIDIKYKKGCYYIEKKAA